jgi:hypothetical protein
MIHGLWEYIYSETMMLLRAHHTMQDFYAEGDEMVRQHKVQLAGNANRPSCHYNSLASPASWLESTTPSVPLR